MNDFRTPLISSSFFNILFNFPIENRKKVRLKLVSSNLVLFGWIIVWNKLTIEKQLFYWMLYNVQRHFSNSGEKNAQLMTQYVFLPIRKWTGYLNIHFPKDFIMKGSRGNHNKKLWFTRRHGFIDSNMGVRNRVSVYALEIECLNTHITYLLQQAWIIELLTNSFHWGYPLDTNWPTSHQLLGPDQFRTINKIFFEYTII